MPSQPSLRRNFPIASITLGLLFVFANFAPFRAAAKPTEDPWTAKDTVQPAEFAAQLQKNQAAGVRVVYVGVKTLYDGAHIPGAVFYGPGSTEQGLAALKKFAATLPKDSDVVLYCGCCPLEKCPNLRPAFQALEAFRFARLRVLLLPTSFNADWVEKGLPVHHGGNP
jgi:thiosulfate/3-mercaptopyruvate sulfurtransferase